MASDIQRYLLGPGGHSHRESPGIATSFIEITKCLKQWPCDEMPKGMTQRVVHNAVSMACDNQVALHSVLSIMPFIHGT